jgi:hypothetical protein
MHEVSSRCFSLPQLTISTTLHLEPLVGQAFPQVKAYITDDGINLTDISTSITILKTAFGDKDHITTVQKKLGELKQTNCDFSSYYMKF